MSERRTYLVLSGAPGKYLHRGSGGKWLWVDSLEKATPFLTFEGANHFAMVAGGLVGSVAYQNPQREFSL